MPIRPSSGKFDFASQESTASTNFSDQPHHLIAHIDGGARGNPGPAGYGVVIEDEVGRPVAELSEYLGRRTNNYAEYSGLLAALSYALKHGFKALKVISDSELMVRQINGQYKVSSPTLKELYERAMKKIDQLDSFEIRHVLREKNREADRLANLAMDRGMAKKAPVMKGAAAASPTPVREVNGVVRNGAVQFLGEPLPEGTLVKIRAAK
jgi:ribonuclease HI